jgi:hypothetical protein
MLIGDRVYCNHDGVIIELIIEKLGRNYATFQKKFGFKANQFRYNLQTGYVERKMTGGWWDTLRPFVSPEDAEYWIQCQLSKIDSKSKAGCRDRARESQ